MNDMNDMTTVLDQHVQAVLNQHVEDLFTYKASDAETAPGATNKKALPELHQRRETWPAQCPLWSLSGYC